MKKNDAFPSTFLKKDDVTRPLILTIDHVEMEEINNDGGKESKAVAHFQGDHKPMVLNSGNWDTLEEEYGDDSDDWAGCKCEIYVDPDVRYGGKKVGGLRVRIPSKTNTAVLWKYAEAVNAAKAAGIPESAVKEKLKQEGFDGWYPSRCTSVVQGMIDEVKDTFGSSEKEEKEEPIPF